MDSSTPQQWQPVSFVGLNTIIQEEKLPQSSKLHKLGRTLGTRAREEPREQDDRFCHIFLEVLVTNNVFLHPQGILNPYKTLPS